MIDSISAQLGETAACGEHSWPCYPVATRCAHKSSPWHASSWHGHGPLVCCRLPPAYPLAPPSNSSQPLTRAQVHEGVEGDHHLRGVVAEEGDNQLALRSTWQQGCGAVCVCVWQGCCRREDGLPAPRLGRNWLASVCNARHATPAQATAVARISAGQRHPRLIAQHMQGPCPCPVACCPAPAAPCPASPRSARPPRRARLQLACHASFAPTIYA